MLIKAPLASVIRATSSVEQNLQSPPRRLKCVARKVPSTPAGADGSDAESDCSSASMTRGRGSVHFSPRQHRSKSARCSSKATCTR